MSDNAPTPPSSEPTPPAVSEPTAEPTKGASAGRAVREVVETLVLAGVIFLLVRMVVLNFRVDGESMVPNLHNEEMLLVNRNAYRTVDFGFIDSVLPGDQSSPVNVFDPPTRGDIIVFDPPTASKKPYIKRVIAVPGERVAFEGGKVYVNGVMLDEPYIEDKTNCRGGEYCDMIVPEGTIFVLGDNRENSSDSRVFGPVPVGNVIGKAWVTYWPPSDMGMVPHMSYGELPSVAPTYAPDASPETGDAEQQQKRDKDRKTKGERKRDRAATPDATP